MTPSFTCIKKGTLPVNRIDDLPTQTTVTPMVSVNSVSAVVTESCPKVTANLSNNCNN